MSDLTIFDFESNSIRTGELDGQPVFCLCDLLDALGTSVDTSKAKKALEEVLGDGATISLPTMDSLNREQNTVFVFESGATYLIANSRTEKGKRLNRWIHQEVLPSLRKTGFYATMISKVTKIDLARMMLESEEARIASEEKSRQLQAQIEADEPDTTLGKAIAAASNCIRIGDFAKAIGVGQNTYFQELRDDSIIQLISVLPYQRYITQGYFTVTEVVRNNRIFMVAMITPKGQKFLAKRHHKYAMRDRAEDAMEKAISAIV